MLWGVTGKIARRLARPFVELSRVAQEIGRGNVAARFTLGRHGRSGEAFLIGASINDMAARIERQLKDQRELLAAVSHEVRTPLARIRMLVELGRTRAIDGGFHVDARTLDDLDREVMEIDALVGELLASSRLDFAAVAGVELDACDVARRALARQALEASLVVPERALTFRADPTLIQRALANLLHNAVIHAGGVDALVVTATDGGVRFEVADRGPGLAPGDEAKVFDAFYRGRDGGSEAETHAALGLGLALVQRIATAHGGRAFAENRTDGPGARIGIEVPAKLEPAVVTEG
jgi:signal transduction histidine kinase